VDFPFETEKSFGANPGLVLYGIARPSNPGEAGMNCHSCAADGIREEPFLAMLEVQNKGWRPAHKEQYVTITLPGSSTSTFCSLLILTLCYVYAHLN